MLRLTTLLCVILFVAFVIGGQPPSDEVTASRSDFDPAGLATGPADARALGLFEGGEDGMAIRLANGGVMEIDAVVRPGRDSGTLVRVGFAPVAADPAQDEAIVAAATDATILVVVGSRVNLRAGPSTQNPVLTALAGGTRTELLEALPNGWMHIRAVDSGIEGFMSGDFLTEAG